MFIFSSVLHDFYIGITLGFFVPSFIIIYAIIGGELGVASGKRILKGKHLVHTHAVVLGQLKPGVMV